MRELKRAALVFMERLGAVEPLLGALAVTQRPSVIPGGVPWPIPLADAELLNWARVTVAAGVPDPMGWTYQIWLGRGARRHGGAYYTPPEVVQYLGRRALAGLKRPARVLDPACGSGVFLADMLARQPGITADGWDHDPVAVQICQFLLPQARVRVVDALAQNVCSEYDVVLGNPPYISSGLRGARRIAPAEKAALAARFAGAAQYKLNTYPLFVVQGLRLLRPGGRLAFILPDSFLQGRYFDGFRHELLAQAKILEITVLDSDFWAEGAVGRPTLLVAEKGTAPSGHAVCMRRCSNPKSLDRPVAERLHPQAAWQAAVRQRFRTFYSDADAALVQHMEEHPGVRPLGECLLPYSGLIARAGQRTLLRSSYPPDHTGPWAPLLRSGREVDRYSLNWAGDHVLVAPSLLKSGGRFDLYRRPKLLLRQTGDDLRATYDDQGFFCLNNLHLLVRRRPDDRHDLRYWLALLNSPLVNRYYRLVTLEEGRVYAQVDLDLLSTVPLRQIDFNNPIEHARHNQIVDLVAAYIKGHPCPGALHEQICALYDLPAWMPEQTMGHQ